MNGYELCHCVTAATNPRNRRPPYAPHHRARVLHGTQPARRGGHLNRRLPTLRVRVRKSTARYGQSTPTGVRMAIATAWKRMSSQVLLHCFKGIFFSNKISLAFRTRLQFNSKRRSGPFPRHPVESVLSWCNGSGGPWSNPVGRGLRRAQTADLCTLRPLTTSARPDQHGPTEPLQLVTVLDTRIPTRKRRATSPPSPGRPHSGHGRTGKLKCPTSEGFPARRYVLRTQSGQTSRRGPCTAFQTGLTV